MLRNRIRRALKAAAVNAVLLSAGAFVAVSPAGAADRAWLRKHVVVLDAAGSAVAEFVKIATSDDADPVICRYLVEERGGKLLVVRREWDRQRNTGSVRIDYPATKESAAFELTSPGRVTLRAGSRAIEFGDDERTSQRVRRQAADLIRGSSVEFLDALRRWTLLGLGRSLEFAGSARSLHEVLFFETPAPAQFVDAEQLLDESKSFDPRAQPPSRFEARFGRAYFE